MADVATKPSVWPGRSARQNSARSAQEHEIVQLRMQIASLESKVDRLAAAVEKSTSLPMPAGLYMHKEPTNPFAESDAINQRLDMLEQIFLLVDWMAIEKAAKVQKEHRSQSPIATISPEPDMELSPSRALPDSVCDGSVAYEVRSKFDNGPVAEPPPFPGTPAHQSQVGGATHQHSINGKHEMPGLLPARKGCCEHSLPPGSEPKLPEHTPEQQEKICSLMRLIMENLDSSKLLNS